MGIKNYQILTKYGSYGGVPKNVKKVGIYLDAEFLHYKGRNVDAIESPTPEFHIATTAIDYTVGLIDKIKSIFGTTNTTYTVYAYFDGSRDVNKVKRITDTRLSKSKIVCMFKQYLEKEKYVICQLLDGESELLMYHGRDQNNDVNIMVSGDSDLFSILYDHRPHLNGKNLDTISSGKLKSFQTKLGQLDIVEYDEDVKDSLMWVFINKGLNIFMCDFMNYNLTKTQFRQLIAYMGTDFTSSLFSKSMLESMFASFTSVKIPENVEGLELLIILICFGFVYSNSRRPTKTNTLSTTFQTVIENANIYVKYITYHKFEKMIYKDINSSAVVSFVLQTVCNSSVLKTIGRICAEHSNEPMKYIELFKENIQTPFDEIMNLNLSTEQGKVKPKVKEIRKSKDKKSAILNFLTNLSNEKINEVIKSPTISQPNLFNNTSRYLLYDSDSGDEL